MWSWISVSSFNNQMQIMIKSMALVLFEPISRTWYFSFFKHHVEESLVLIFVKHMEMKYPVPSFLCSKPECHGALWTPWILENMCRTMYSTAFYALTNVNIRIMYGLSFHRMQSLTNSYGCSIGITNTSWSDLTPKKVVGCTLFSWYLKGFKISSSS